MLTSDVVSKNCRSSDSTSGTIRLTACVFTVLESSLHYHLIGTWFANGSDLQIVLIGISLAVEVRHKCHPVCMTWIVNIHFFPPSPHIRFLCCCQDVNHTCCEAHRQVEQNKYTTGRVPGSGDHVIRWQRKKLRLEEDIGDTFRWNIQPVITDDSIWTCEDWNRFLTSRMRTFGKSEDILASYCYFKRPFDGYDLVLNEEFLAFPLVCFIGLKA